MYVPSEQSENLDNHEASSPILAESWVSTITISPENPIMSNLAPFNQTGGSISDNHVQIHTGLEGGGHIWLRHSRQTGH